MSDRKPVPFQPVLDAMARGKASWCIHAIGGRTALTVGAPTAVTVQAGVVISIGMTHEELLKLREAVDSALKQGTH